MKKQDLVMKRMYAKKLSKYACRDEEAITLYEESEKSLKQKAEELSKGLVTFKSSIQIAEYIQTGR